MRRLAVAAVVLVVLLGWATIASAQTKPASPVFGGPDVAHVGDTGLTPPAVLKDPGPRYTAQAMRAGVDGTIKLECIVKTDGSVGDVRVIKSLDQTHGTDDEAVKTLKQWRFKPGRQDGKAVPVAITVEFQLHVR